MIKNARELIEAYEEALDCEGPVKVLGDYAYYPSQILKQVDPVVYRAGLLDYAYMLEEEGLIEGDWDDWNL